MSSKRGLINCLERNDRERRDLTKKNLIESERNGWESMCHEKCRNLTLQETELTELSFIIVSTIFISETTC